MFNEHLILKVFGHIIWNWHLFVWLLGQFPILLVFKSVNSQSLFRISFNIYPRSISRFSSIKICSNLKICWNFLETSKVPDISSEVPKILRKFRTFFGTSGYSAEVPDFEFFPSHIQHTPSPLISPKLFPQLPAPQTLPSLPLKPLSLQTLTPKLKSPEVPQIPGSLDSSGWKFILFISIVFPRASPQGFKVFS